MEDREPETDVGSAGMDRRDVLKRLGVLLGGVLSGPVAAGVLGGCRAETEAFETLDSRQAELVAHVAEMILPETDTPGAKAARVDVFIDKMLTRWFAPDDRRRFLDGLAELEDGGFLDASAQRQMEILRQLDGEAVQARNSGTEPLPFFAVMKEMTLVGYYTSETGGAEELQYVMLPGRYDGNVAVTQVGRAYSRCNAHN